MSKGHRDNHAARLKRGSVAFAKKEKRRRVIQIPCNVCGTRSRPSVLVGGFCPPCISKANVRREIMEVSH